MNCWIFKVKSLAVAVDRPGSNAFYRVSEIARQHVGFEMLHQPPVEALDALYVDHIKGNIHQAAVCYWIRWT